MGNKIQRKNFSVTTSSQEQGIWQTHRQHQFLATTFLLGAIGLLASPLVLSPSLNVNMAIDVSRSNISSYHASQVLEVCQQIIDHLEDEDSLSHYVFADQFIRLTTEVVKENHRQDLKKQECQQLTTPNPTLGQRQGTDLPLAIEEIALEVEAQKNRAAFPQRTVILIVISNAERRPDQKPIDFQVIKTTIQSWTQQGHVVVFLGVQGELQHKLREILKDNPRTRIANYKQNDAKYALDWAFKLARRGY